MTEIRKDKNFSETILDDNETKGENPKSLHIKTPIDCQTKVRSTIWKFYLRVKIKLLMDEGK